MTDRFADARPRQIYLYEDMIKAHGEKLGTTAIAVYCAIAVLMNDGQFCYASLDTIGKSLGISENTVRAAIKKLEETGWMRVYRHQNSTHHYYLTAYEAARRGAKTEPQGAKTEPDYSSSYIGIVQYQKWGFTANPAQADILIGISDAYDKQWVIDAFEIATKAGKLQINYVEGILKRWKATGRDNGNGHKPAQPAPVQKRRIVE